MEIYSAITTLLTIILGGGWFIFYRANKRIKEGEASQSEAEGWRKQQEVYQTTIADQQKYYEHLKEDFNIVLDENTKLRQENNVLRDKMTEMENQMFELRREVSRLGRKVAALSETKKKNKKNNADSTEG